jgi:hypothetical protein
VTPSSSTSTASRTSSKPAATGTSPRRIWAGSPRGPASTPTPRPTSSPWPSNSRPRSRRPGRSCGSGAGAASCDGELVHADRAAEPAVRAGRGAAERLRVEPATTPGSSLRRARREW